MTIVTGTYGSLSGTWQCMGSSYNAAGGPMASSVLTLYVRIA
jgi:hypothetical protein